jgi:TraM recognition site of TraD and TraG/Helicase HerA, central domain
MAPTNEANLTSNSQHVEPLAPLEHLFGSLLGTTEHVTLGLLFGLFAARAMRRWHLHWSWAAGAFGLVLLAHAALAGGAVMLGVAALAAAVRGRRWHGEDVLAGADLASIAVARTTPLDWLGPCARSTLSWLVSGATTRLPGGHSPRTDDAIGDAKDARVRKEPDNARLSVGLDRHGRSVAIELGGRGGGTHTLVAGATGSGKTYTQTWILTRAIARGFSAIVVDPKGDASMLGRVRSAASDAGKPFLLWTPDGPAVYNPYGWGGETEIADRALAGERFTEPHYQRQAQRYLGHAVRALRATGRGVSLAALVQALDPGELELLARELSPGSAKAVHSYLDSLTARGRGDLSGVRDRLAILAESDVGRWLDPDTSGAESFALLDAIRGGAVAYFSLRTDSRPLLGQMLGSAIVGDLRAAVSALQARPARCVVAIDEFSAIAAEHVAGLFARARSAGVNLLLGAQELSDLRLPGRETLQDQVLGNLTSVIAHRQAVPASAELIARLSGTRGAWRTTVASDGRSTRTRVSEPLIATEEVMSLPLGVAAVIRLASPRSAAVARMHSPA